MTSRDTTDRATASEIAPAKAPKGKIDYVLTSNGFRVVKARVLKVYASDHLPVVVDLVFEPRR